MRRGVVATLLGAAALIATMAAAGDTPRLRISATVEVRDRGEVIEDIVTELRARRAATEATPTERVEPVEGRRAHPPARVRAPERPGAPAPEPVEIEPARAPTAEPMENPVPPIPRLDIREPARKRAAPPPADRPDPRRSTEPRKVRPKKPRRDRPEAREPRDPGERARERREDRRGDRSPERAPERTHRRIRR